MAEENLETPEQRVMLLLNVVHHAHPQDGAGLKAKLIAQICRLFDAQVLLSRMVSRGDLNCRDGFYTLAPKHLRAASSSTADLQHYIESILAS